MAYIEAHQKLEKHPKLLELLSLTGWDKDQAIGKLIRLWWWALDYAEDGDLSRFKPHQFLGELNGGIDSENLYKHLQDTNFIEKNGLIHDWLDYAGRYLTSKYRTSNPSKLQMIEKKYKSLKRRSKDSLKSDILPNTTLSKQDNLIISAQADGLLLQFTSIIQEKIKVYIERNRLKNKSQTITEGRKVTLITELWNSKERCADDKLFGDAMEAAIIHDACNIGYVNAVIKNKKTKQ